MLPLQQNSTQEPNGHLASIPSEIKHNAVHAGPSEPVRFFQTDSVLLVPMSSFPHKTWYLATAGTWAAMEVFFHGPGPISPLKVLFQKHVSHTPHKKERSLNAHQNVKTVQPSRNTNVLLVQLLKPEVLKRLKPKSSLTAQLKLVSLYMKISCNIQAVSTNTLQEANSVDMPSKSLDGELTIGLLPTHGLPLGEKKDSSESVLENADSTVLPTVANPNSEHVECFVKNHN